MEITNLIEPGTACHGVSQAFPPPAPSCAGGKTPITAAGLLNNRVVPFFDEKEVKPPRY
jgi:hypothetical protein